MLTRPGIDTKVIGAHSIDEFCRKLKRPRKVILLVKAGSAVDAFIEQLLSHLEADNIAINGGNSHSPDSIRRTKQLEARCLLFVGCCVSGGEKDVRYGPSMMPGGSVTAWPHLKPIFQAIAAKADDEPCCDWVGETSAGHYVKMDHNGIEYGDMQLIREAYHVMRDALSLGNDEFVGL